MTELLNHNDNDTVSNGTQVTTANSTLSGQTPYDRIFGTVQFDQLTGFTQGDKSLAAIAAATTGVTNFTSGVEWTILGGGFADLYWMIHVQLATATQILRPFQEIVAGRSTTKELWSVHYKQDNTIQLRDATNSIPAGGQGVIAHSRGSRIRLEGRAKIGATQAVNVLEIKIFSSDPDGTTPDETLTIGNGTTGGPDLGGNNGVTQYWQVGALNPTFQGCTVRFDSPDVNDTGYTFGGTVTPPAVAGLIGEYVEPFSGGGANDACLDPNVPGRMYVAYDVGNSGASDDYGETWHGNKLGQWTEGHRKQAFVAAFKNKHDPAETFVVAGCGDTTRDGTITSFGGDYWSIAGGRNVVGFAGQNADPLDPQPRSVCNLADYDAGGPNDGALYVGTFKWGVGRSTDFGTNYTLIGFREGDDIPGTATNVTNWYIRTIALDPDNPGYLYVGLYDFNGVSGAYRLGNGALTGTGNLRTGTAADIWDTAFKISPAGVGRIEHIKFLGGRMFVAAAFDGLYEVTKSSTTPSTYGTANWRSLNGSSGLVSTQSWWLTVNGYVGSGGAIILFAGCDAPQTPPGETVAENRATVIRTLDVRATPPTWQSVTDPGSTAFVGGNININDLNTGQQHWRFTDRRDTLLGRSESIGRVIMIDPTTSGATKRIWIMSGANFYKSENNGNTWQLMIKGVAISSRADVNMDMTRPGYGIYGDQDHDNWFTSDYGDNAIVKHPGSNVTLGHCMCIDLPATAAVNASGLANYYFCNQQQGGAASNNLGFMFKATTISATNGPSWVSIDTPTGKRVGSIVTGLQSSGTAKRIVIYELLTGFRTSDNEGATWSSPSGPAIDISVGNLNGVRQAISWASPSQPYIFCILRSGGANGGLWRSGDRGSTWTQLWAFTDCNDVRLGYVLAKDHTTIYVSKDDGSLHRIRNAHTTSGANAVPGGSNHDTISQESGAGIVDPTCMGFDPSTGDFYVYCRSDGTGSTPTRDPRLWKIKSADLLGSTTSIGTKKDMFDPGPNGGAADNSGKEHVVIPNSMALDGKNIFFAMPGSTTVRCSIASGSPDPDPDPDPTPTGAQAVIIAAGDFGLGGNRADGGLAAFADFVGVNYYSNNKASGMVGLGDHAYDSGILTEFNSEFDPEMGTYMRRNNRDWFWPTPGSHDYGQQGAAGALVASMTGFPVYFEGKGLDVDNAGNTDKYYNVIDILSNSGAATSWRLIRINGVDARVNPDTDGLIVALESGSPQFTFLQSALQSAETDNKSVVIACGHPRWTSPSNHTNETKLQPIWDLIDTYRPGRAIVLAGHNHNYERFYPQTKTGARDDVNGNVQFVAGTAGQTAYDRTAVAPNSAFFQFTDNGVLELTLKNSTYDFRFVRVDGQVLDSGTTQLNTGGGVGGTILISDAFNRANSTTTMGNADTGQAWIEALENWGISGNKAYIQSASGGFPRAEIDSGVNNGHIEADITLSPTSNRVNVGVHFRGLGTNNHLFVKLENTAGHPAGVLDIMKMRLVGGSVILASVPAAIVEGQTYHVVVDWNGLDISTTLSGGTLTVPVTNSYTLAGADATDYATGSFVGLRGRNAVDEDDLLSVWDNFVMSSTDVQPTTKRLTVNVGGTGTGSVTSSPTGIGGSTFIHDFTTGTVVTLTGTSASGTNPVVWGGAGSGTTTRTVTMSADQTVTATFDLTSAPAFLQGGPGVFKEMPEASFKGTRGTWWPIGKPLDGTDNGRTKEAGRPAGVVTDDSHGYIYIYGYFDRAFTKADAEVNRFGIFRIRNTDYDIDPSWAPDITPHGDAVYPSGSPLTDANFAANSAYRQGKVWGAALSADTTKLYIVGDFTAVNGAARGGFAAFNTTTGALLPDGSAITNNGYISGMFLDGTDMYLTGNFTTFMGSARNRGAKISVATATPTLDATYLPLFDGPTFWPQELDNAGTKRLICSMDLKTTWNGGASGPFTCVILNKSTGAKIAGINSNSGEINDIETDVSWQKFAVAARGGGGNRTYTYPSNLTSDQIIGTHLHYFQHNGDSQGLGKVRAPNNPTKKLLVTLKHDDFCAAVRDSAVDNTEVAHGIFITDQDLVLQSAPWRSRLQQNGSDPVTGGGVLRGWGAYGDDAHNRLFVWGDYTRIKDFAGNTTLNPVRRIAIFHGS